MPGEQASPGLLSGKGNKLRRCVSERERMKVWAKVRKDNKTIAEHVVEIGCKHAIEVENWAEPIGELCRELDLSRPVILRKHIRDLESFSHTVFRAGDFMERIDFDRLEIELF